MLPDISAPPIRPETTIRTPSAPILIVEAMAQLGGLLMSRKLEHTGKIAVLLSLDKVKLRRLYREKQDLIEFFVSGRI